MGCVIDYQVEKNITSLKFKGRLDFKIAQTKYKEAAASAHRSQCNKFLVDHTETELHKGNYRLHADGPELEQFGFNNKDKVAIVILPEHKSTLFDELISKHTDWSNFRYFDNAADAMNWLTEEDE